MAGYTRQSAADIVDGEVIEAQPLNDEFDALQTAFGAVTGHAHDGTTGNAPKINLTTSVSGILPVANGGTGVSSGTFVTLDGTQTLTNKSLSDSTTYIIDNSDATKKLQFQVSGITTATTRTLTAPDFDGTIATLAGTETFTNKTLTSPTINGGALSGTFTDSFTTTGLQTISRGDATTQIEYIQFRPTDYTTGKPYLAIKKNTSATKWSVDLWDGVGNTGTLNFGPSILTHLDVPIVTTTGTQTLTNKTLTSPTIAGGTLSGTFSGTPTYSGLITSTVSDATTATQYLRFSPSDTGAGKPYLFIKKEATASTWSMGLWNGTDNTGTIDLGSSILTHNGVPLVTTTGTQTLTNKTLTSPTINSGALSGTFSGAHTYSGLPTVSIGTATTAGSYMEFTPTDYATGKPKLFFSKSATANVWNIGLFDTVNNNGIINFQTSSGGGLQVNAVPVATTTGTETLTNKTLTSPTVNSGTFTGTITNTSTFSANVTVGGFTSTSGATPLNLIPSNYSAGNPQFFVNKGATASKWNVGITDGVDNTGTINFQSSILTQNDVALVTTTGTQTLTNKTLTSPNIDSATFRNGYTEETYTSNTGTALTIDLANGTVQILTLTGNCTYTFPANTAGQSFLLIQKQDATGSRTVTWDADVKWPNNTAPTLTATASKADLFAFTCDGTYWYGRTIGQVYL